MANLRVGIAGVYPNDLKFTASAFHFPGQAVLTNSISSLKETLTPIPDGTPPT